MCSKIVLGTALLVALQVVDVQGDCIKQLAQWLKGGEKNGKVLFNVFSYEGEKLEPMEIDWKLKKTDLGKLWNKLKAKYENETHKIEEMALPVYMASEIELYWITFDPKKLDQKIEEINKSRFKKILISIFGSVWLTETTPKILLYLKPKSEPENEFTVKVYKTGDNGEAGEKVEAKAMLGEVKFTDVDLNVNKVADYDILKKVSEQWPSVTKIHVTSFSNGSIHEGTIENPLKSGLKSYSVRALRLEIEMTDKPKK